MLEFISDKLEKIVRVVSKWRGNKSLPKIDYADDPISKFLHQKYVLQVISSNVDLAKYDWEEQILYIRYTNGDRWRYKQVSQLEAERFVLAGSKGDWLWSNVRVRGKGNKHLHKKPAEPYQWE